MTPPTTTEPPKVEPPPGAPETYTDWTLPENYVLDAGVKEEAGALFKSMNLPQDATQKLVDLYTKHAVKAAEEQQKAVIDAWADQRRSWREGLKSDPEIGKLVGSNGNFGADSPLILTVNRALTDLQNPKLVSDFKEAMDMTGAGDNPAFVRVLYALASKVTEGTSYVKGEPVKEGARRPTAGAAMYPDLPSGQTG